MINDPRPFRHRTRGAGRPRVVLCGNGLERAEGQPGWGELLNALRTPGVAALADGDPRWDMPFPLLYQLLSTPVPASPTLSSPPLGAPLLARQYEARPAEVRPREVRPIEIRARKPCISQDASRHVIVSQRIVAH